MPHQLGLQYYEYYIETATTNEVFTNMNAPVDVTSLVLIVQTSTLHCKDLNMLKKYLFKATYEK